MEVKDIKWEEIVVSTYRMKVPGGWIIKSVYKNRVDASIYSSPAVHQVFIPDNNVPTDLWKEE